MTNDELRSKVDDVLANMDLDEYTNLWNRYCNAEGNPEEQIYRMEDFNDVFRECTPFDVADSLSREFSTGDPLFVFDPCYTISFEHPTDYLSGEQIDNLTDWVMEGNDGDFEELRDLLSNAESKERHLLTALATTMCNDERCASCQGGWDVENLMSECFEWEDGEPVSGCLFGGWVDEVDDNIYLEFNAKTMRYALRLDIENSRDPKGVLIAEGNLEENDFLHTDVDRWLLFVVESVYNYWQKMCMEANLKMFIASKSKRTLTTSSD